MSKITDPTIIENSKELLTPTLFKKDVEKVAVEVLEELGDDVINKAIEEGKIVIPTGFGVVKRTYNEIITREDYNKLITGEYVFITTSSDDEDAHPLIYYPLNIDIEDGFVSIIRFDFSGQSSIGAYTFKLRAGEINNITGGNVWDNDDPYKFDANATKLYLHNITLTAPGSDPEFSFKCVSSLNSPVSSSYYFEFALGNSVSDVFYVEDSANNENYICKLIYKSSTRELTIVGYSPSKELSITQTFVIDVNGFTDNVTEL